MSDYAKGDALASLLVLVAMGIIWVCCADTDPKACAEKCRKQGASASALVRFECVCFRDVKEAP